MSNTDTILAVVISGCPIDADKWQYTPDELKEIAKRAKKHEDLPVVRENLARLGAVPDNEVVLSGSKEAPKEAEPAVIDLTEESVPAPAKVASLAELATEPKPKRATRKTRATKTTVVAKALDDRVVANAQDAPNVEETKESIDIKPKKTKIVAAVTKQIKKKAAK